jgi:hypothetical protein
LRVSKQSLTSNLENVNFILPPDEKVEKTFPVIRGRTWAMLGKFCNAEFVLNLYKFPMLFIGKKKRTQEICRG